MSAHSRRMTWQLNPERYRTVCFADRMLLGPEIVRHVIEQIAHEQRGRMDREPLTVNVFFGTDLMRRIGRALPEWTAVKQVHNVNVVYPETPGWNADLLEFVYEDRRERYAG